MTEPEKKSDLSGEASAVADTKPVGVPDQASTDSQSKKKIVQPGSSIMGGSNLLGGPTIADQVGKGIDAAHSSKDSMISVRHALSSRAENKAFGAVEAARSYLLNVAWHDHPDVVKDALRDQPEGWTLANKHILRDGNLLLAVLIEDFMRGAVNHSYGIDGWAGNRIEKIAKSFGSSEADKGKLSQVKNLFGKGEKK